MAMNKFERWFLKRILKKEVCQGFDHDLRIQALYKMIRNAAAQEFNEDNKATLDSTLQEWFERSKFTPGENDVIINPRHPQYVAGFKDGHSAGRKRGCSQGECRQKAEFDAQC
jgi:hypothetical protein